MRRGERGGGSGCKGAHPQCLLTSPTLPSLQASLGPTQTYSLGTQVSPFLPGHWASTWVEQRQRDEPLRTLEVMRARGWDTDHRGIAAIIIITALNNWSDHIFLHLPLGSAGEASPGLEMAQDVNQNGSTPLQLPQCVGAL